MPAENATGSAVPKVQERELIIQRVFQAPRETVYDEYGAIEGAKQRLDRLEAQLACM